MRQQSFNRASEAGFSLMELIIAMTITLVILGIATTLIAKSLRIRTNENSQTDALADVHRGMNIMTREISNAGFNLTGNGIVLEDSDNNQLRIVSNLNGYTSETGSTTISEASEDVKYYVNDATNTNYLVRYDNHEPNAAKQWTVLANRIDSIHFHYFDRPVTYTTTTATSNTCDISSPSTTELAHANLSQTKFVVVAVCVKLDQVGEPGSDGYVPAHWTLLVSDVALRNAVQRTY